MKEDAQCQIKELISQTKYEEALEIVQKLEQRENIPPDERLQCLLLKAEILVGKGEHEKGLNLAETVLSKSQESGNFLLEIDTLILQAEILENLGKLDESLKLINQCEQNLFTLKEKHPTEFKRRKAEILYWKGRNLWQKADPERAIIPLSESLTIFEELGNKHRIALCYRNIGAIHGQRGEIDRSIEYYEQSYHMSKEIGNKNDMAACLNNIGVAFRDGKNDPVKAIEYFMQSLKLAEEINDKPSIIFYLRNLGTTYHVANEIAQAEEVFQRALTLQKEIGNEEQLAFTLMIIGNSYWLVLGDLDRGLDYLQKSLKIYDEIGDAWGLAFAFSNIGWVYKMKGELELAIEYANKSLAKHQEIDEPLGRTWPLLNLALVYQAQRELEKAKKYAKKTLALSETSGNESTAAHALYLMANIALDNNQEEEAREFAQQLHRLYTQGHQTTKLRRGLYRPLKQMKQLSQITDGLILKTSPRLSDKAKAQEVFREIAEEPVDSIVLTSTATLHLCDLLLFELKASGDEAVLQETKKYIREFQKKAQTAHSYISVVNTLILQSKLNTVEGKLTEAAQLLDQAAITAEEKGLSRLLETVKAEKLELETQFDTWKRIIQSNTPFHQRLEQAQVESYLQEALKIARLGGKSSPINE